MKTVVLGCDRSGGHFYPALALAQELKSEGQYNRIVFYGAGREFGDIVKEEGFVWCGRDFGFRFMPLEIIVRFFNSLAVLIKYKPGLIVGFGGRNSFWLVVLGSFFCKAVIFEPNAKIGRANKVLQYFSRRILSGFGAGAGFRNRSKVVISGIPLRRQILDDKRPNTLLAKDKPVLLVCGGSQGSVFVNSLFMAGWQLIKDLDFKIIHITGRYDYSRVKEFYKTFVDKEHILLDYGRDMAGIYKSSDFALCRAGAVCLAELNYFGIFCFIVPLPLAGMHQQANAREFASSYPAVVLKQDLESAGVFAENFRRLLDKGYEHTFKKGGEIWTTPQDFCRLVLS